MQKRQHEKFWQNNGKIFNNNNSNEFFAANFQLEEATEIRLNVVIKNFAIIRLLLGHHL